MNKLSLGWVPFLLYSSISLAGFVNSGIYPLDTKATTTNIVFTIDDSASMDFEIQVDGKKNGVDNYQKVVDIYRLTLPMPYIFPLKKNLYDAQAYLEQELPNKKIIVTSEHYYVYPFKDSSENNNVRNPIVNTTYYNPKITYNPWPTALMDGKSVTFTNSNPKAARSHPYLTSNGTGNVNCIDSSECVLYDLTQKDSNSDYSRATYFLFDNSGKNIKYDINLSTTFNSTSFKLPDGTVINRSRDQELQNFANWFTYYRNRRLLLAGAMGKVVDKLQTNYANINATAVYYNKDLASQTLFDFNKTDDSKNGRSLLSAFYKMTYSDKGTPARNAMIKAGNLYKYSVAPFSDDSLVCSRNNQFVLTDGFGNDYNKSVNNAPSGTTTTLFDIAQIYYKGIRSWTQFTSNNTGGNQGNTVNTYAITLGAKGDKFPGTKYSDVQAWETSKNALDDSKYSIDDLWHASESTEGKMLYANDADTLEQTITEIIRSMVKTTSHTNVPVSTKYITEGNNTAVLTSYNTGDWTSEIKAHPIIVDEKSANYGNVDTNTTLWSASEILDAMPIGNRKIATYSGSKGIPFTFKALTDENLVTPFNNKGLQDAEEVIAYLRGDRSKEGAKFRTRGSRLGDIINSSPIFVTGAEKTYSDSTYATFKAATKSRKKMIYVGANDGMLHAFDSANGNELWAYVPKMVHSKLIEYTKNTYLHDYFVDGPITSGDVQFVDKTWKTVIVGGLRNGGQGFYALDVTKPEAETDADVANKVLWEFTDPRMGKSFGTPRIIKTSGYGWVALLTSGYYSNSDTVTDGNGYLFVVGIEKGNLIKAIPLTNPSNTNYNSNPVGFTQIQTMPLAGPNTDKTGLGWLVYGGDLNGNVWRFDISAKDKENWTVRKFASKLSTDGTGRPITTSPALGYIKTPADGNPVDNNYSDLDNKEKRLMVYIGTGKLLEPTDIDKSADKNQKHGFFALEDYAATLTGITADNVENKFIYGEDPCKPFSNCLVTVGLGQGGATDPNGLNNWSTCSEVDGQGFGGCGTLQNWWIRYKYGPFTYGGKLHVKRGWYVEFSDTGSERVISDPVFGGSFVTFNTTMITDWRHGAAGRCENVFSAQYVLGSGKGGTLGADKFKDGVAWSRKNLGFGIASSGTLFVGTDGYFRNITNTGGKITTTVMPEQEKLNKNTGQLRRWGWHEIYR